MGEELELTVDNDIALGSLSEPYFSISLNHSVNKTKGFSDKSFSFNSPLRYLSLY